jgi:hypothetical protein
MPKGRTETLIVTKHSAARSQLESAIWLWFNEGDPISIHTLAVAAHDCFHALVWNAARKPSDFQTWLASKSKGFQKRARLAQNFFKHGAMDLKAKIQYETIHGEMLMMDAVTCYEMLIDKPIPLMRLYATRFLYEHPTLMTEDAKPTFAKNAEVHQLTDSTRKEFFQKLSPIFRERYSAGTS